MNDAVAQAIDQARVQVEQRRIRATVTRWCPNGVGNISLSNGMVFEIFVCEGTWDYVERVTLPDGTVVSDVITEPNGAVRPAGPTVEHVLEYRPRPHLLHAWGLKHDRVNHVPLAGQPHPQLDEGATGAMSQRRPVAPFNGIGDEHKV